MFEEKMSKVYVETDSFGRIIRCEGQYTLPDDLNGWALIEEGPPCDRLNLAQSHYFPEGIYTSDGIPRYKLLNGKPAERTEEEIAADRASLVPTAPTALEQLRADVDFLAIMQGVDL